MTKQEIIQLTGENPVDMFGGDWRNIGAAMEECEDCLMEPEDGEIQHHCSDCEIELSPKACKDHGGLCAYCEWMVASF